MTVDQLPDQSVGDVVDVPSAFVGRDLGVESDLQQEIAELVTHGSVVIGVDRRQELVGLLQEMAREGAVRLLAIPRASIGFPQPRLDLHQVEEPLAAPRRRHRPDGDVIGRVAGHHDGEATEPVAGEVVALGSVLVIRTTWSVEGSNRPKLGSTSIAPA
jgi:hypothetical protein